MGQKNMASSGELSLRRLPSARRHIVTLSVLLEHVAGSPWCLRHNVRYEDAACTFAALCEFVANRVASGVGVRLPSLGSFTVGPAFVVDPRVGRQARGGVPVTSAPVVPLCFHAVTLLAALPPAFGTPLLRLLLDAVAGYCSAHADMYITFGFGALSSQNGVFSFVFAADFYERLGVSPHGRVASPPSERVRHPRRTAPEAQPVPESTPLALLLAACEAADPAGAGVLPRRAVEQLLRAPGCAAATAALSQITLITLLDAASENAGRAVSYTRLLAMLGGTADEAAAAHLAAAAAPEPALSDVPAAHNIYASRRAVEDYNRRRAAEAAERSTVAPKIGARTAVLIPGTPLGIAIETCPLAARKQAEAQADRERFARVTAMLAAEREAAAAKRQNEQAALRAALDAQVVARRRALHAF
jgi:hypothetical protein